MNRAFNSIPQFNRIDCLTIAFPIYIHCGAMWIDCIAEHIERKYAVLQFDTFISEALQKKAAEKKGQK